MMKSLSAFFNHYMNIGASSEDSAELKLKKSSLLLVPLIIGTAAFFWGLIYIALDQYLAASIPLSYSVISIFNLWHLHKTKDILVLQKTQMVLVLFLPFLLMWTLGGFALGSFVMIWAFFAPIAALTYEKNVKAPFWFYAFIGLVVFSSIIDQGLAESHTNPMPQIGVEIFFFLNISAGLSGIYYLVKYYINEKEKDADELLRKEHIALLQRTNELKEANLKLKHLADHDALTGLPNQYHLRDRLSQMISDAKKLNHNVAFLFIDLDGFKDINDRFGHVKGDEVLKMVSSRIRSLLREEDTLARLGGDEFVVALGSITDITYVESIAQRIIDEINREYEFLSEETSIIGASIGISLVPEHSEEIDDLINYADEAMYHIKHASKNDYFVYEKTMKMKNENISLHALS